MWENSKIFVRNEEGVGLQQNSWLMLSPPWWTCLIHLFFSLHLFSQIRGAPFWDKSGMGDMPASLLWPVKTAWLHLQWRDSS